MNLNIYPKNAEKVLKPNWIIRTLNVTGALNVVLCVIAALIFGAPFVTAWLYTLRWMWPEYAQILGIILSGALGYFIGMMIGLPYFALAMALDDIHATRIYSSAYLAFEVDDAHLGK